MHPILEGSVHDQLSARERGLGYEEEEEACDWQEMSRKYIGERLESESGREGGL